MGKTATQILVKGDDYEMRQLAQWLAVSGITDAHTRRPLPVHVEETEDEREPWVDYPTSGVDLPLHKGIKDYSE